MMTSLKSRIISFSLVLTLLLAGAAAVVVQQVERYGRSQRQAQLLETTRALSLVVSSRLEGYERLLTALAASDAVRSGDYAAVDRQARAALTSADTWITLGTRDGRQLVNTRLAPGARLPRGNLPPDVWAQLDLGLPRVCNLVQGLIERQITCVDVPIMRHGRATAHLTLVIRPRLFQSVIADQRPPAGHIAAIIDRNGKVIWRNVQPERFVGRLATADMRRQVAAQSEGAFDSVSLDGVPTTAAFSRSAKTGWTFIVAIPRKDMSAGAVMALKRGALVAGLFVAAAAGLGFWHAKGVTRAVGRLKARASTIGDPDAPPFRPQGIAEIDAAGAALEAALAERNASRETFELAQDVGGIGAWRWDFVRNERVVTDAFRRMHDLGPGPLSQQDILDAIHPDDLADYIASLEAGKTRREPTDVAYRVLRKDGGVRWIAARGRPLFDASGAMIGAIGVVRDSTLEHEAQAALTRVNALLTRQVQERTQERDRLWTLARDPFVVADENGVWLEASPAWTEILGYAPSELLGRTSEWMEHPDDRARTRAEDQRLASGLVTERFENRFRDKDGAYRWFSWTSVPEGNRFYSVARDVTQDREQAKALRAAEDALRQSQKMESIGQITGGVAHDFNNLLMPIIGTLDLLQQRGLPDERSERMIVNALEAADRARMLVQRLLAFARRQPLNAQAVDLPEALDRVSPLLSTTLGPQVRLTFEVSQSLPPVRADGNQLELALLNLAVNARDAMPDGGGLTIKAAACALSTANDAGVGPGHFVEIAVQDTGVGMPASVVERAIEPFFSTKGIGRGTGLGLSMVHGLMAQLGGGLSIDSQIGAGTTVRLWLPVAEAPPVSTVSVEDITPRPMGAGRALLVDDEASVRASISQMLSGLGYDVVEAASAADALQCLVKEAFDILVTDHLMPGMTGTELGRRAVEARSSMRVLIVSGYADVDDIAPDLPRLAKPFRQADLANALRSL